MNRTSRLGLTLLSLASLATAQPFQFPTPNRTLLEPNRQDAFFVGTVGKPWTSGTFGCVRTDGLQLHEGLDIRCLERDSQGEPIDPIFATADGVICYINNQGGLSNYGRYLVIKHLIEGIEVFSLYAHLGQVQTGLREGSVVNAGQVIATMGRTTNTRQPISKERAHLHFEITLLLNERFPAWYENAFPGYRNDHGQWNGQNLAGIDPQRILEAQAEQGAEFSLLNFLRTQTELCRVVVRDTSFPWLKRYTPLIRRNPLADQQGVAAYEVALNFTGVPFLLIPRAQSELKDPAKYHLISVNEAEAAANPCRRLVARRGGAWHLTNSAIRLLDLLTE